MFDRSLIHEAGGGEKVSLFRRDIRINNSLEGNTILDSVDFIQVPPSSEDYILPTGQVLSSPDYDAFIPLDEYQLDFVLGYLEDNKCLPIMAGDVIRKSDECELHITRVDFGSGWILLNVEEESNY